MSGCTPCGDYAHCATVVARRCNAHGRRTTRGHGGHGDARREPVGLLRVTRDAVGPGRLPALRPSRDPVAPCLRGDLFFGELSRYLARPARTVVDDTGDPVSQKRHVEVQDQSYSTTAESEIRQQLAPVNLEDLGDGLYFHDHEIFNDKVQSKPILQTDALVDDRKLLLSLELQPSRTQLKCQAFEVGRFEQAGAKVAVYLDPCLNDPGCELVRFGRSRERHGEKHCNPPALQNPTPNRRSRLPLCRNGHVLLLQTWPIFNPGISAMLTMSSLCGSARMSSAP